MATHCTCTKKKKKICAAGAYLGATDVNWGWFITSLISPKPVMCLDQQKIIQTHCAICFPGQRKALAGAFAFQQIFLFFFCYSSVSSGSSFASLENLSLKHFDLIFQTPFFFFYERSMSAGKL